MPRHWSFYPCENRLVSGSEVSHLTGKASAVLEALVRRQGEVVSRDEILQSVWPDVHVTPDLVREYIFDLRRALGDDASDPMHIETVRGKGFRLLGGVLIGDSHAKAALQQRPRIAVLRPELFGGDDRWRQVADALGQEVTVDLARYPDLAVISRHSSFARRGMGDLQAIASVLNADYLVAIALTIGVEQLNVTFQLIDGGNQTVLSSCRIEHAPADLPSLTVQIAARISADVGRFQGDVHNALLQKLRRRPSSSTNAYEEYLLSIECEHIHSLESWRRGLEHANRSIELDPHFARAWHMRGTFLRGLVNFFVDPQIDRVRAFRDAVEARRRSIELDARDPQILAWSADLHIAENNEAAARNALVRAADLGRNQPDTLAYCAVAFALVLGSFQEAARLRDQALALSPNPPDWYRFVDCRVSYFVHDYERCDSAARAVPNGLPSMLFGALSFALQGRSNAANQAYARLTSEFPDFDPEQYAADMMVSPSARSKFMEGIQCIVGVGRRRGIRKTHVV